MDVEGLEILENIELIFAIYMKGVLGHDDN